MPVLVEIICQQLDNTWQYFTTTFKVQVILLQKHFHSHFENENVDFWNTIKTINGEICHRAVSSTII